MRAFIAVPLTVELKTKLTNLQQDFRHLAAEAAWVRAAGFHLTLKFLGEIEPAQVASIGSCMSETVQNYHPFPITLSGVGIFPNESQPRVLWVGIRDQLGHLAELQRTLEANLLRCGFSLEDRLFRPHLTLARLKRIARRAEFLAYVNRHSETTLGALLVEHLELIESQLHPSGARYIVVKVVPLAMPTGQFTP